MLPFAEREYIDVNRAAKILGVSQSRVLSFYVEGHIDMIDYRSRSWKKVRYQSVVDFCDALRIRFCIKDRRPALSSPMLRHRDEDILPFPLADTISIEETMKYFYYSSRGSMLKVIEEGRFDAYQFNKAGLWRVSRSSLALYLESLRRRDIRKPSQPNSVHVHS